MNRSRFAFFLTCAAALACGAGCASQKSSASAADAGARCGEGCRGVCACASAASATASGETVGTLSGSSAAAMREALMDERMAQALYRAVMAKHGEVRPFSNIVHAEERHEQMVAGVMRQYGLDVPAEEPTLSVAIPSTVGECARLAAEFERANIALYDRLLEDVTEAPVREVFERLRSASKNNHLPAFERAMSRGMARGSGARRACVGWGGVEATGSR